MLPHRQTTPPPCMRESNQPRPSPRLRCATPPRNDNVDEVDEDRPVSGSSGRHQLQKRCPCGEERRLTPSSSDPGDLGMRFHPKPTTLRVTFTTYFCCKFFPPTCNYGSFAFGNLSLLCRSCSCAFFYTNYHQNLKKL
jgi:hypothetical protein